MPRFPAIAWALLVVALLAGCAGNPCQRIATPSARGIPATAPAVAGDGPVTLDLKAVDDLDGHTVPGARLLAFWKPGDARAPDFEQRLQDGDHARTATPGFLADPHVELYLPANLSTLAVQTDAAGAAQLLLPEDQPVGIVYTAPAATEEFAVVRTPPTGTASLELDLFRTTIAQETNGSWQVNGPADPGTDRRWMPTDIPLGMDRDVALARLTVASFDVSWDNAPPASADLDLRVGTGGQSVYSWGQGLVPGTGPQTLHGDLDGSQLLKLGGPLQAGPGAAGPQVSPLGAPIPFHLTARLAFERSAGDFRACLAPADDSQQSGGPAGNVAFVPLVALVFIALVAWLVWLGASSKKLK